MRTRYPSPRLAATASRRRAALAAVTFLSVGTLAACGDDDDEVTDQEKYCASGDELQASLDELFALDPLSAGADGVGEALSAIQDDIGALKDAGEAAAADELDALDAAISGVGDAVSALGDDISADSVSAIGTAIGEAFSAADAVIATLSDCE